ncbi:PEP-CTERM sorting domain-containing protein [Massilia sp. LjRoot122]|uniref:PEP-CTERM sorting domain-containing protein n=1 Tax=Massilia sp. LjRoot122 TaxID=3342257 RepID=UPI003ECE210E
MRRFFPALAVAVLALPHMAATAAPAYVPYTVVSGKYASAVALNDKAHYAVNSSPPDVPFQVASISDGLSSFNIGHIGGSTTRIRSLNNHGDAVGEGTTHEGALQSFLYSDGQMRNLTVAYGLRAASAINDAGTITGQSADNRAMTIRDGKAEVFGPPNSTADAINDRDDVLVGYAPEGFGTRTAIYSRVLGTLELLPLLGGPHLVGTAISNDGWATGYGFTGDNRVHAFLYDGAGMLDLTPSAGSSTAYDINNLNHIVGSMDNRAFWYGGGVLVDLNTLIDPEADILLTAAIAINDHDQILAKGCDRAGVFCYDTVLLNSVTAIPEPETYLMLVAGLAFLAARRLAAIVRWHRLSS